MGDFDSSGSDMRTRALRLPPWYPQEKDSLPALSAGKIHNAVPATDGVSGSITGSDQGTLESRLMNKARRLAYRFYSLPYDARIEVAQGLHLFREEDEGLQDSELFNRLLLRAKEENLLSQLWDDVQKAHGDNLYSDNPYREGQAD